MLRRMCVCVPDPESEEIYQIEPMLSATLSCDHRVSCRGWLWLVLSVGLSGLGVLVRVPGVDTQSVLREERGFVSMVRRFRTFVELLPDNRRRSGAHIYSNLESQEDSWLPGRRDVSSGSGRLPVLLDQQANPSWLSMACD